MTGIEPAPAPCVPAATDGTVVYDARDLIVNGVKAHILLNGQAYTLRITRAGNLILTK